MVSPDELFSYLQVARDAGAGNLRRFRVGEDAIECEFETAQPEPVTETEDVPPGFEHHLTEHSNSDAGVNPYMKLLGPNAPQFRKAVEQTH